MLLLYVQMLQVVYLIGVTELHVTNVDFMAHIARNSVIFSDPRKKIIYIYMAPPLAVYTYMRIVTRLLSGKVRSASICGCPVSC